MSAMISDRDLLREFEEVCILMALDVAAELENKTGRELSQVEVVPSMRRSYDSFLELVQCGESVQSEPTLPLLQKRAGSDDPGKRAIYELLVGVRTRLSDAFIGQIFPEEILFEMGQFDLIESFYYQSSIINRFLQCALNAFENFIPGSRLHILELGAGSGCTCDVLMSRFKDRIERYEFTDISPTFIKRAKTKFQSYPQMAYTRMDIDKLASVSEASYDLVTSMNCIHVAENIKPTLKEIHRLLKPGGTFLLGEVLAEEDGTISPLIKLSFGMLPSFWRFKDTELRTGSPLLSKKQWLSILSEVGFKKVNIVSHNNDPDPVLVQFVAVK